MEQKVLPLSFPQRYTPDTWVEADCNHLAFQWIQKWAEWPQPPFTYVWGPAGSGKTHLAHIFHAITDGYMVSDADKQISPIALMETYGDKKAFIIEDIELYDENWLFALYNTLLEYQATALWTASVAPASLAFKTPDLLSRWKGIPVFALSMPDDFTIREVLRKQLADRGIIMLDADIEYLLAHIPRSFEAIRAWANRLDWHSTQTQKKISRPLLRQLIAAENYDACDSD